MFFEDILKKTMLGKQVKTLRLHSGVPSRNLKGMIVTDIIEGIDETTGIPLYGVSGTLKGESVYFTMDYKTELAFVDYDTIHKSVFVTLDGKEVDRTEWIFLDLDKVDLMDAKGGSRTTTYLNNQTVVIDKKKTN